MLKELSVLSTLAQAAVRPLRRPAQPALAPPVPVIWDRGGRVYLLVIDDGVL